MSLLELVSREFVDWSPAKNLTRHALRWIRPCTTNFPKVTPHCGAKFVINLKLKCCPLDRRDITNLS